ncbi:MAG: class I mannose-6-phosphate isomerase [Specibacter sp.]
MSLLRLTSNQPADRFYRGGAKIRGFRSSDFAAPGSHMPEDWVGSTTTIFGEPSIGLSLLGGGERLRDAVADDPAYWLGEEHLAAFGADTMVLVKLLDAGQRLPIHLHPTRHFAATHLGRSHGKAEAWLILEGGTVHLGFRRDVQAWELAEWVRTQDTSAMLAVMHVIEVRPGDSVFVPPGMPHAIGEGVFLVEVQEPEDLSILLEWDGFALDGLADGHLGLGFKTALTATDHRGRSVEEIGALITRAGAPTLATGSERFFRAERLTVEGHLELDAGFGVVVVTAGAGNLETAGGQPFAVAAGDTLLVPHGAGRVVAAGSMELIWCRPPAPGLRHPES